MQNKKIRVCVIDDEDVIRNALIESINSSKELTVICEAKTVDEGVKTIIDNKPDLIFLDIKLIGGDAFMLLNKLENLNYNIPPLVINTGFDEFKYAQRALNEYKQEVLMILKKPFWEEWDEKGSVILKKYYEHRYQNEVKVKNDRIIIKTRYKIFIVRVKDIVLLKIFNQKKGFNKTLIETEERTYEIRKPLNYLEAQLTSNFIRINRTEIINGNHICEYDHTEQVVYIYGREDGFGVGNRYKLNFLQFLENL